MFSVPKNIRQIGQAGRKLQNLYGGLCLYFSEEKSRCGERRSGRRLSGGPYRGEQMDRRSDLCIHQRRSGCYTYIYSAEHIDFTEEMWKGIHEELKKYFEGQEIAGWFFAARSLPMETTDLFQRVHLRHFGGGEKVLMLMDPAEQEEAFFQIRK